MVFSKQLSLAVGSTVSGTDRRVVGRSFLYTCLKRWPIEFDVDFVIPKVELALIAMELVDFSILWEFFRVNVLLSPLQDEKLL